MNRKWLGAGLAGIAVVVIAALLIWQVAPQNSILGDAAQGGGAACLTAADGACLALPQVTGVDVDNQPVAFPDDLSADYTLIVMPFDREQQVEAADWLPLFQTLAEGDARVDYVSIAALPDLNAAVRLLVIGGMSAGVSDATVRERLTLLFLDEQDAFLDALTVPDTDAITVWIVDAEGVIYYCDSGTFTPERAAALEAALSALLGES